MHSVGLSLLTNLTVVVIPSSRAEWLKFERNYSFAGLKEGYGLDAWKFWRMCSSFKGGGQRYAWEKPGMGCPSATWWAEFISRCPCCCLSPLNIKGVYCVANQKHHRSSFRKQRGKYLQKRKIPVLLRHSEVAFSYFSLLFYLTKTNKKTPLHVVAPCIYMANWSTRVTKHFMESVMYSQKYSYIRESCF